MKKLDKQKLLDLGFQENLVSKEESGDVAYVYYTLELKNNDCLITTSHDLPLSGKELYTTEIFNMDGLGFCETETEVRNLYKALTNKDIEL